MACEFFRLNIKRYDLMFGFFYLDIVIYLEFDYCDLTFYFTAFFGPLMVSKKENAFTFLRIHTFSHYAVCGPSIFILCASGEKIEI